MAKHIVHPARTKEYETNYALPFINVIVEFSISVNVTLQWLQRKYPEKPRVTVIKEEK